MAFDILGKTFSDMHSSQRLAIGMPIGDVRQLQGVFIIHPESDTIVAALNAMTQSTGNSD